MPDRVVDYLVRTVADRGITQIFGVDGANIEDLYDAIFDAGDSPAGIVAKHEFSAATMADGYARSTGGMGVVAATSGGGAMNLVAGLAESYTSRVPVLALIGQPPTALEGHGAFQDSSGLAESIDATALFATVSRYCARVTDPAELPAQLAAALTAAESGGPAVLLIPKDVQQQAMPDRLGVPAPIGAGSGENSTPAPERQSTRRPGAGPPIDPHTIAAELTDARRTGKVVIIAGDQIARDNARGELAALVAALDAAIGLAPDAKDVYSNTGPGYCGVAGSMGHAELADALSAAGACLLVGTRLPVTARAGLDAALAVLPVLSIGACAPYLAATHATSTDLAETIATLLADLGVGSTTSPRRAEVTPMAVPEASGPGLRYRAVVEAIAGALPEAADVFADAGNTGASVVHYLRVPERGRFTVALGMGGMGYAFGAGIGSAFARRGASDGPHRTVVIAGDGSFFMHGMEIHTAIEHDLPITFVVFNNNAHAMCVTREQLYYRNRYSFNRFQPSHLGAGIAAMFPGLPARTVSDATRLSDALDHSFAATGPSFLEILCDPDEVPPFLPFLSALESSRSTP
ncbi:thiamine pyrophosphate-binding protein [Nocardia alba]|uniref:acetolactate synthase n=1 Tax=Nocardia alba TaxID=225051 RepID=A0A4R1G1Z2_9NOCA|nr:thiamine pyrophosphate-binding protein [Nocardia alba]TCK00631.1 acetolactate synthase-1/2/3 large subunit [Nocardia alba]